MALHELSGSSHSWREIRRSRISPRWESRASLGINYLNYSSASDSFRWPRACGTVDYDNCSLLMATPLTGSDRGLNWLLLLKPPQAYPSRGDQRLASSVCDDGATLQDAHLLRRSRHRRDFRCHRTCTNVSRVSLSMVGNSSVCRRVEADNTAPLIDDSGDDQRRDRGESHHRGLQSRGEHRCGSRGA